VKKSVAAIAKKAGEKAAMVPTEVRSWPWTLHQPKMPVVLAKRMNEQDKR